MAVNTHVEPWTMMFMEDTTSIAVHTMATSFRIGEGYADTTNDFRVLFFIQTKQINVSLVIEFLI